jgi:hypothetical protein
MDALSIAFDIIVVGALALGWVLLVIHLFFSDNETNLKKLVSWVKEQEQPALVGVLLFAMAFPLGSAVSRIAQDFFDDDDLHIQVFHHLFRVGVTESSIRTDVFCNTFKPDPPASEPGNPPLENPGQVKPADPSANDPSTEACEQSQKTAAKLKESPGETREPLKKVDSKTRDLVAEKNALFRTFDPKCTYTGRWVVRTCDPLTHQRITSDWIEDQDNRAADVFHVHEATVLLKGTDATERIRQFHDQIMVLRGAAFNGMIAFSLCLFWWSSKFQSGLRWAVPTVFLFPGLIALYHHLKERAVSNPPYMEFTLLVLAAAGWCLLWQRRPKKGAHGQPRAQNGRGEIRFAYLLLSLFLTVSAFLGWWATQVLYDQQVIFSYKSLSETPTEPSTPSQK